MNSRILAASVGTTLLLGICSAAPALATPATPMIPNCTPTEGSDGSDAVFFSEVRYTRTVTDPGNGQPETIPNPVSPTIPNPDYKPGYDETYVSAKVWRHWLLGFEKEFPVEAKPQGFVFVRDVTSTRHVPATGGSETLPNPAYTGPTVANPDYVGPSISDQEAWVREDRAPEGEGWTATGETRATTEVKVEAVAPVEANTCETATMSWVMPNGGTPDNVTWPQPLATGSECGVWLQVDVYRYGTAAERAIVDAFDDDGVLSAGEDSAMYLSHRFVQTEDCAVEPKAVHLDMGGGSECIDGVTLGSLGWETPLAEGIRSVVLTDSNGKVLEDGDLLDPGDYTLVVTVEDGYVLSNDDAVLNEDGTYSITWNIPEIEDCEATPVTPEEPEEPTTPTTPVTPTTPSTPVVPTVPTTPVAVPVSAPVQPSVAPAQRLVEADDTETLAVTGGEGALMLVGATALLAAGGTLVVAARRRRQV